MSRQSDAVIAAIEAGIGRVSKALVLEIDRNLRQAPSAGGTPVDTGHARANWVPSVGSPHTGEVDGASAHAAGVAAVLRYKPGQGALYVSNNAAYITLLNLGYSPQAAVGFIEAAIEAALATTQAKFAGFTLDINTRGAGSFGDTAGGMAASNMAGAYSPFGD